MPRFSRPKPRRCLDNAFSCWQSNGCLPCAMAFREKVRLMGGFLLDVVDAVNTGILPPMPERLGSTNFDYLKKDEAVNLRLEAIGRITDVVEGLRTFDGRRVKVQ